MRLNQVKVGDHIDARRSDVRTRSGGSCFVWEVSGVVTSITSTWESRIDGSRYLCVNIFEGDWKIVSGRPESFQARRHKPQTAEQLDALAYWAEIREIDRINRENGVPMLRWTGDGYASNNPLRAA